MKYISTRGKAPALNFEDVLLTGLASDGGLYVPETLPQFSTEEIASWQGLAYHELAFHIISPFVDDCIPAEDLRAMLKDTYATFEHPAVAPLVQLDHNEWVLELFQGPTLAFKDFALQLLGRLLDYVLEKRQQRVTIMGATSGDTGSAAIEGCRRCKNVDIFILHPYQRVSDVQRRQMTTVLGDNIHNIAIKGNFDDCQNMVKASFSDQSFLPQGQQLVAVNSINWARIMAQIVYYFYASLAVGGPHKSVAFSVPTGNFGDIFAGYLAKKMGLPVHQLVIATNKNDVLHRVMTDAQYARTELYHTLSPSMDISISSNFERLMLDLVDGDAERVRTMMETFKTDAIHFDAQAMEKLNALFASACVDDAATCATIASVFDQGEYMLDPHSATGVFAARHCRHDQTLPTITLATAHPAKFPEAIIKSGIDAEPKLPHPMQDLLTREEQYTVLDNDLDNVKQFMLDQIG